METNNTTLSPLSYARRALHQRGGMTLVEVMIAVALAGVLALAAGTLMVGSMTLGNKANENSKIQSDLSMAIYHLRGLAQRAIDVRYLAAGSLNNSVSNASEGWVRSYSYRNLSDPVGATFPSDVLMYFNVEEQTPLATGVMRSDPRPTAIFFTKPTNTRAGQIRVVSRNSSGELMPTSSGIAFDGVTSVETLNPQFDPVTRVIRSVTLRVVFRYFLANMSTLPRKWCPIDETSAACQGGAAYRDVERDVVLQFDNNQRPASSGIFEFASGAYFFKTSR